MMPSQNPPPRRIWAISDIHIDYPDNKHWLERLCSFDYHQDVLLIAGDATDQMERLKWLFEHAKTAFKTVSFVPGNHELWLRQDDYADSLEKLAAIIQLCREFDVYTEPFKVTSTGAQNSHAVWVVPLFSWYVSPDEGSDGLYLTKNNGVEDNTEQMWMDYRLTRWPELHGQRVSDVLLAMNHSALESHYDAPILSFSHFLPRQELMFKGAYPARPATATALGTTVSTPASHDPYPAFNFSKVAGCQGLDQQIRQLGSTLHIYGHQHRNRNRVIDGVHYISHCLGYPKEWEKGYLTCERTGHSKAPLCVWRCDQGFIQATHNRV